MKITEKEVRYVAELANLRLTDDEIHAMAHDMDEVLVYMEKLNQVNTDGVEPMAQVLFDAEETSTLREDVVMRSGSLLPQWPLPTRHKPAKAISKSPR